MPSRRKRFFPSFVRIREDELPPALACKVRRRWTWSMKRSLSFAFAGVLHRRIRLYHYWRGRNQRRKSWTNLCERINRGQWWEWRLHRSRTGTRFASLRSRNDRFHFSSCISVHMKTLFKEMAQCKSEIRSLKSIVRRFFSFNRSIDQYLSLRFYPKIVLNVVRLPLVKVSMLNFHLNDRSVSFRFAGIFTCR